VSARLFLDEQQARRCVAKDSRRRGRPPRRSCASRLSRDGDEMSAYCSPRALRALRSFLVPFLLGLSSTEAVSQQPQEPPRFRSSVEVTSLDATAVDDHGRPDADLKPEDFTVRIDGNARKVVSAEWISLVSSGAAPAPSPPDGYTTNESSTGGRLIVLA